MLLLWHPSEQLPGQNAGLGIPGAVFSLLELELCQTSTQRCLCLTWLLLWKFDNIINTFLSLSCGREHVFPHHPLVTLAAVADQIEESWMLHWETLGFGQSRRCVECEGKGLHLPSEIGKRKKDGTVGPGIGGTCL